MSQRGELCLPGPGPWGCNTLGSGLGGREGLPTKPALESHCSWNFYKELCSGPVEQWGQMTQDSETHSTPLPPLLRRPPAPGLSCRAHYYPTAAQELQGLRGSAPSPWASLAGVPFTEIEIPGGSLASEMGDGPGSDTRQAAGGDPARTQCLLPQPSSGRWSRLATTRPCSATSSSLP